MRIAGRTWIFRMIAMGVALVAAVLLAAGLAGCSGGGSADDAASGGESGGKTLTVAMELAYPPFETRDEAGDAYGISPAFMQKFADAYGYDLVIENTAFDGLIPAL